MNINRFFHRADACRKPTLKSFELIIIELFTPGCLLGRLLPRALLKERGVPDDNATIERSAYGRPFFVRVIDYNIDLIVYYVVVEPGDQEPA